MPNTDAIAMRIARTAAREAMGRGALAVVLTGSQARGDAGAGSDIDLVVVFDKAPDAGSEPAAYSMRRGRLVATAWTTPRMAAAAFRDPARFPTYVPGWREAVLLADPDVVAARIQARARRWEWDDVADATDAYVAEQITGWAEEVHKLVAALERGQRHTASVQRSLLAVHLAGLVALQRRILWGADNALHDLVSAAMGEPWASVQSRAFGEGGESHEDSCRAALELYGLAAGECSSERSADPEASPEAVGEVLNRQQRAVVGEACAVAGVVGPA